MRGNAFGEDSKLLLDKVPGLRVGDLAGPLVQALCAISDKNLRFVERDRVKKHHRPANIVLHRPPPSGPGDADCKLNVQNRATKVRPE